MAKINPWGLRPVRQETKSKTFTDPFHPSEALTFTLLTGFDLGRELLVSQIAIDLNRRYVLGTKDEDTGEMVIEAIEPVGGVTPTVNGLAIQKYARLIGQQAPGPDAYGFKEIAALSVTLPNALWEAVLWAESLLVNTAAAEEGLKKTLKKAPAEDA